MPGSTVVLGMLAALTVLTLRCWGRRSAVVAGVALMVLAVGVSRIYLGAHWLTDVLTGWLLGGAWLAVGVTALRLSRPGTERAGFSGADGGRRCEHDPHGAGR